VICVEELSVFYRKIWEDDGVLFLVEEELDRNLILCRMVLFSLDLFIDEILYVLKLYRRAHSVLNLDVEVGIEILLNIALFERKCRELKTETQVYLLITGHNLYLLPSYQRITPELDLSKMNRINQGTVDGNWGELNFLFSSELSRYSFFLR